MQIVINILIKFVEQLSLLGILYFTSKLQYIPLELKTKFSSFESSSHKEITDHLTHNLELVVLKHVDKDIKSDTGGNTHIDDKNFGTVKESETQQRVYSHHQFNEAGVQNLMSLRVKLLLKKELP